MRIAKALGVICAMALLSLTILLFVAGCGFRVSTSDFPVLKLSNETATVQEATPR
jgi:hypothetical protein